MSHELSSSAVSGLLAATADIARTAFGAAAASIMVHDADRGTLRFAAVCGAGADRLLGYEFPAEAGIAGWVLMSRNAVTVHDVAAEEMFGRDVAEASGYIPRAIVAQPIMDEDESLGVMELLDPSSLEDGGPPCEPALLALLALQAAVAIRGDREAAAAGRCDGNCRSGRALAAIAEIAGNGGNGGNGGRRAAGDPDEDTRGHLLEARDRKHSVREDVAAARSQVLASLREGDDPEWLRHALRDTVGRPVDVRCLLPHSSRTDMAFQALLLPALPGHSEVRTAAAVTSSAIIVDGRAAHLANGDGSTLTVTGDGLAILKRWFDDAWRTSVLLTSDNGQGPGLGELHREILLMLTSGMQDETIARRLSISVRTCRRHIARIMESLEARTRFQAGTKAAQHQPWLSGPAHWRPGSYAVEDSFELGDVGPAALPGMARHRVDR